MLYPKVSAILNNCPLHAVANAVKREVLNFRDSEHHSSHADDYALLKDKFAEIYGFNPEDFTFKQFADLLESYNDFDTQILMGPVLRSFMRDKLAAHEMTAILAEANGISQAELLDNYTTINANTGRYESLSPDELATYVALPLGISIRYKPENGESRHLPAENAISTVNMFHKGGIEGAQAGGHWELTDTEEQQLDLQHHASTQLSFLAPLLGQDPQVNPHGLELLRKHITLRHHEQVSGEDVSNQVNQLKNSAELIERYVFNTLNVPKALAIRLLGDNITPEARAFIQNYDFPEVPKNQVFERYINAVQAGSTPPKLSEMQRAIADRLLAPVDLVTNKENQVNTNDKVPSNVPTVAPLRIEEIFPEFIELDNRIKELNRKRLDATASNNVKKYHHYNEAYQAARELKTEMVDAYQVYADKPEKTIEDFNQFKKDCLTSIEKSRPTLEKHSGWKSFLINLAIGVSTAGLGLLIKGAVNYFSNRSFMFSCHTKAGKAIEDIEEAVKRTVPPPR